MSAGCYKKGVGHRERGEASLEDGNFCSFDNHLSEDGFCTQSRPKALFIYLFIFRILHRDEDR